MQPELQLPAPPTPAEAGPAADEPRFRVLLVDDEPRLLHTLQLLLDGLELDLHSAGSGEAAIEALGQELFDLVLLDLRMPGIDGNGVMEYIRARALSTKVVIVSGETAQDAAIGAIQRGATDYLRKPYRADDLLATVDKALAACRREREQRRTGWRLASSEQLYRTLVDNSPDVIYTIDGNGLVTFLNGHGQQLFGADVRVVGQHFSTLIHDEDVAMANYVLAECLSASTAIRDVELRFKGLAGEPDRVFEHTLTDVSIGLQPLASARLPVTAAGFRGVYVVARDATERQKAQQLIARHAHYDALTGLPNRLLFNDRLGLAISQAQRSRSPLGVMFIDLDGFKAVNDTLGHMRGDELLQQVAARLKSALRNSDTLARQGGDEFTIALPELPNAAAAAVVAGKFIANLQRPFSLDGNEVHISACIGIAIYPDHGETIEQLLRNADLAMYQVKAEGKNGYRYYDPSMDEVSNKKDVFERSLGRAVEAGELELYYQPQVDVRDGRILGVEALMRWNHPTRGLLAAAEFLPFAEQNRLMIPISDWMLDAMCRDLLSWNALGGEPLRLSMNLSPQYLDRGNFVEKMRMLLERHGLKASQLEIEIPETLCIGNPEHAASQLNQLSQLGVTVAIDDFGTGYSSLAYLHRFPIHTIKIDHCFVSEIQRENGHFPVVQAIIAMAIGLGLKLVAEGVESEVQARYLMRSGCTTMQGFHFHRPVPSSVLLEMLRQRTPGSAALIHPPPATTQ